MSEIDISELAQNISAVERETGLSKDVLRMWERRYVLAPLSEIAPDVVSEEWEQRLPAGGVTRVDELDL